MGALKPAQLVLRCYGYRTKEGTWVGVCLDLNLATEADSLDGLRRKMNETIDSYLETVLDTEDKESIPRLLYRRAPLRDWLKYYLIRIKHLPSQITFNEYVPFHLAHTC